MKLKSLFFLIVLFVLFALPTISFANVIELKIKGVGLESTLETVKAKLGKPISEKKYKADENCFSFGEMIMKLKYSGLEIELLGDKDGKIFKVKQMTLTSSKWKLDNGITIGTTDKQLMKKIGKPEYVFSAPNQTYNYNHKGNQSGANFIFNKNGKIAKIEWDEFLC